MALETLAPDAVLDSTNYTTLNLADIDEDPDSPDASFGTWDGNGNTSCRVSFPSPTGSPTVGAGLQEFRVLIQRTGAASLGWSLQLWENGVEVAELATGTLTTASAVVSGTWNASLLGTADGSLVECRLQQTSGGTGGGRQGIEVGAVEWNADYTVTNNYTISGALTVTVSPTASALQFNQNPSITGSQVVTVSPTASALDYTRNAAIAGALSVTVNPTASSLIYASNQPEIVGSVPVAVSIAAAMAFNRHYEIQGGVLVDITPTASALDYTRNAALIAGLLVNVGINASMDYTSEAGGQSKPKHLNSQRWRRIHRQRRRNQ